MVGGLAQRQARYNALSRDRWRLHGPHRRQVTGLARGALPARGGRLCVLGAGNLNDLDLSALVAVCDEIHLVDLDPQAMAAGLAGQGLADAPAIRCHGVDLSGCVALLDDWTPDRPTDDLLAGLAAAAPSLPSGPFHATVSACLLTQMIEPVIEALGPGHPRLPDALKALRRRHVEILLDLLAPGGTAVLVSDVVASDSVPGLAETPQAELKALLLRLLEQRNFFSGANPFALLAEIEAAPELRARLDGVAMIEPWIWPFSAERCYLVTAIALRRRSRA